MQCIEDIVNDIYYSSNVPFQLVINGGKKYSSSKYDDLNSFTTKKILRRGIEYTIKINCEDDRIIGLLELCVNNYLDIMTFQEKEILLSLIKGESINKEIVRLFCKPITRNFKFVNINLGVINEEVINWIKECYRDSNIEIFNYENSIIMIGEFDNVEEDSISISEVILNEISEQCYISYSNIYSYNDLKIIYNDTKIKLEIAQKYDINKSIFDEKDLKIESIIDSISDKMKENILEDMRVDIAKLNDDMIETIDVLFKCDLNLSEAAKALFVHRNTLIYRLDKIEKCTSYDIREFNNAMLFKIVFFLLKRKNTLNS